MQDNLDSGTRQQSSLLDEYLLKGKGEEPASASSTKSEVGVVMENLSNEGFLEGSTCDPLELLSSMLWEVPLYELVSQMFRIYLGPRGPTYPRMENWFLISYKQFMQLNKDKQS